MERDSLHTRAVHHYDESMLLYPFVNMRGRRKTAAAVVVEAIESRVLLSLTPLHVFTGGADGSNPTIVGVDSAGDIFGVTNSGTNTSGIVFKIPAGGGALQTLQTFAVSDNPPTSVGAVDAQGDFFDTTFDPNTQGGELFEIAAGTTAMRPLHTFAGSPDVSPNSLVLDGQGNLYGATYDPASNTGAIFEIAAGTTTFMPIHTFADTDGFQADSLAVDAEGDIFGTTSGDGTNSLGEVFKIAADTTNLTVIQSYPVTDPDSTGPGGELLVDSNGDVFGTTEGSMDLSSQDSGSVFEIPAGTTTLNTLESYLSEPSLIGFDRTDNLYGVSYPIGGESVSPAGNLFEIAAAGKQQTTGPSINTLDSEVVDPQGDVFVFGSDPLAEIASGSQSETPVNVTISGMNLADVLPSKSGDDLFLTVAGDDVSTFGEIDDLPSPTPSATVTTQLDFAQEPMSVAPGDLPSVVVQVEDETGNVISNDNSAVTLTLNGTGTLEGTTTVNAINGIATFGDLSIQTQGQFTMQATDGTDTPATSTAFTIGSGQQVTPPPTMTTSPIVASLTGVKLPATALAGGAFKVRVPVDITNNGPAVKGLFTINMFTNSATTLDGNQVPLPSVKRTFALKAGKSKVITIPLKSLPPVLTDGAYYVLAQLTAPGNDMDVAATDATVQVAAPFVGLDATLGTVTPATILLNKSGTVSVTIANEGNVGASGLLDLALGVSADGSSTVAGITLVDRKQHTKIKAGKSVTVKLHFKRTSSLAAGTYYPAIAVALGENSTSAVGTATFTANQ